MACRLYELFNHLFCKNSHHSVSHYDSSVLSATTPNVVFPLCATSADSGPSPADVTTGPWPTSPTGGRGGGGQWQILGEECQGYRGAGGSVHWKTPSVVSVSLATVQCSSRPVCPDQTGVTPVVALVRWCEASSSGVLYPWIIKVDITLVSRCMIGCRWWLAETKCR